MPPEETNRVKCLRYYKVSGAAEQSGILERASKESTTPRGSVSREPEIQFKRGKCARGMWRRSSRKRLLRMIVPVKKAKGGNREKRRQARAVCWERPKQGERRARSTSQSRTRNTGTGVYFWGGLEAAVDVCLPACLFQASQMHTWQVEISLHFPSLS